MANVSHASLTGTNVHEPKGIATATAGQVYLSDGSGSGVWTGATGITTGMISDFATPVAPPGWLELDGSAVSTTTFAALFSAMTVQQNGTRGSGLAFITGLSSTTHLRPGYFVFGTGIASGTTILTVDSATQITMSANASSSGTATVIVSPWLVTGTTITLPNTSTAARFRRSRSATVHIGVTQADTVLAHTHAGTTGGNSSDHTHPVNIVSGAMNSNQSHHHTYGSSPQGGPSGGGALIQAGGSLDTSDTNIDHTHTVTGNTDGISASHFHTFPTTTSQTPTGGTENRPISLVVMTCVKT